MAAEHYRPGGGFQRAMIDAAAWLTDKWRGI